MKRSKEEPAAASNANAGGKLRVNRPASSRQAQEYLNTGGSSFGNAFAAFQTFQPFNPPINQSIDVNEDTSSSSSSQSALRLRVHADAPDASINQIIKRMVKRDPITKLRAIDELTTAFKTRPEVIDESIPAFISIYQKLASENDRRVREGIYAPIKLILQSNKRAIGPYMKQIFPIWWQHCFDPCKEVADAAFETFQFAFSTIDKQQSVLRFAHQQFVDHTITILTSTPTSLSDMTVMTTEQAEERYSRMVAAALSAFAAYVSTLDQSINQSNDKNTEYEQSYSTMFNHAIKLIKSNRSVIRRAVYQLCTIMLSHCHTLRQSNNQSNNQTNSQTSVDISLLSPLVIDAVGDTDKSNAASMWDAVLKLMQTEPHFIDYLQSNVDDTKQSNNQSNKQSNNELKPWKRMFTMIRQAGFGASDALYHNALPLLASLPSKVMTRNFLATFFDCLFNSRLALGQSYQGIYSATIDMTSTFLCFLECALYVIANRKSDTNDVSATVLDESLLPVLRHLMKTDETHNSSTVISHFASSLVVIARHQSSSDTVETFKNISLSHRLSELCESTIEQAEQHDDISTTLWSRIETLLIQLHHNWLKRKTDNNATDFVTPVAAHVLDRSINSFKQTQSVSSIHCARLIASTFDLNQLVTHFQPTGITSFCDKLLSLLQLKLTSELVNKTTLVSSMTELMSLINLAVQRLDHQSALDQLVRLAHILCESSPMNGADLESSVVLAHLTALACFIENVSQPFIATSPETLSEAMGVTFDDEALNLTEYMLTCSSSDLDLHLANVVGSLMPLLSVDTQLAIVDSLLEGLAAFDQSVPRFGSTLSAAAVEQFEKDSGVKMHSVPSLISVLTPFASSQALERLESDTSKVNSMRQSLLTSLFFAQFSRDDLIRGSAAKFWLSLDHTAVNSMSDSLSSIAETFRHSLLDTSVVLMTSEWIVQWTEQAVQLIKIASDNQAIDQLINVANYQSPQVQAFIDRILPDHVALRDLLTVSAESTDATITAERLRIIRDCIGELSTALGGSAIVNESGAGRVWLVVDLLAINEHLTLFSEHPAIGDTHGADQLIESALQSTSFSRVALERLTDASLERGRAYSDALALAWARVAIQPQDFTQLVLRHLLLPLAKLPTKGVPSSMTALIQPLAAALPTTLTEEYASSVSAFLSAPDIKQTKLDALVRGATLAFDGLRVDATVNPATAKTACRILLVLARAAVHWDQFSGWMTDQLAPMLEDFVPTSKSDVDTIATFHRARVVLALAQFYSTVSSASVMRRSLNWLEDALNFAINLSTPTAHSLLLLIEAVELAEITTRLFVDGQADQSMSSIDFMSTSRLLFKLACSPAMKTISVVRFELTLERLLMCLVLTVRQSNGALAAILDDTPFMHVPAAVITNSNKPLSVAVNDPAAQLFSLLAHPFTQVAVRAYELISMACLHRAVTAMVDIDDDRELDDVKRSILDEQKSNPTSSSSLISEEQLAREEDKRRKHRQAQQQRKLRDRVNALLPTVFQCVLEQRMEFDDRSKQPKYDVGIFASDSLVLRLRGHLLCDLILLDLMESTSPLSRIALSEEKRNVIIAYLREFDLMSPIFNEAIQHVLVASNQRDREAWLNQSKAHLQQHDDLPPPTNAFHLQLDATMLQPHEPVDVEARSGSINVLDRFADLQRQTVVNDTYVDESIFYPTLGAVIYLRGLRVFPVLARAWFTNTDRVSSGLVNKCTGNFFSPVLIQLELSSVSDDVAKLAGTDDECELKVRADASSLQVNAKYTRGEVSLGLALRLAPIHPLQPVAVEFTDSVRLSAASLRKWQVAITSALSQSNGGVVAAIAGWRDNIDKQLAGVEECSICMSIVNPQNHSLPRIKCPQCKQGFHSICIFQWFEKSGNSTCPLCRTAL